MTELFQLGQTGGGAGRSSTPLIVPELTSVLLATSASAFAFSGFVTVRRVTI